MAERGDNNCMPDEKPMLDFRNIYVEYYSQVVGYLRQLVGAAEAEDLAQEVFLKINRSLAGFRGESQLATWIYRIARNTALDRLRCASARPVYIQSETITEAIGGHDDTGSVPEADRYSPAAILAREEMNECIRGMVPGPTFARS